MIQRRQLLLPRGFGLRDVRFAVGAASVARVVRKVAEDAVGDLCRVTHDAHGDLFGQTDAVRVNINLDDFRVSGPVLHAVAGQGGEWVQTRAEAQNNISVLDQLHASLGAVVAQRTREQGVRAGEGIVVLIADADRCIQFFSQRHRGRDAALGQDNARTVQDNGVLGVRQQVGSSFDGILTTGGGFEFDWLGDFDIDDLGPEIAWDVDLRRTGQTLGLRNHAGQNFGDARWVTDFFLVGNHVFEQFHLLNFLEATLTDGFVRCLWRDQQKRCVVPVGCFDSGHKVGDAGAVLRDHHRHFARGAGVAVCHHASGAFVGAVPEGDPSCGEDVGDRHHSRADDPEGMLDAVGL